MATNWVVPSSDDVAAVLNSIVGKASNFGNAQGVKRIDSLIPMVVARFRGAIQSGNTVALSLTAGAVPPEAQQHVATLVADAMVSSTPGLAEYAESKAFVALKEGAEKFITQCLEGRNVTAPMDPDPNATPNTLEWGDDYGNKEDRAAGFITNQFGEQVPIISDDMNTY